MLISLAPAAAERIRELTGGAYRLEIDGSVVILVSTINGEVIPLVLVERLIDGVRPVDAGLVALVDKLSKRERVVFEQLGLGRQMNDIARQMGVSVKTVETYRARIKQKLGVKQRMQLLRLAVEWALLNDGERNVERDGQRNGDGKPGVGSR